MVLIEDPDAVHRAWEQQVKAQEEKRKVTGEAPPEEEDDSHPWFKSAHERRQVGSQVADSSPLRCNSQPHCRGQPRARSAAEAASGLQA